MATRPRDAVHATSFAFLISQILICDLRHSAWRGERHQQLASDARRQRTNDRLLEELSSCAQSNGKQYDKGKARGDWSKTLDGNLPQQIGDLFLAGAPTIGGDSPDCLKAV